MDVTKLFEIGHFPNGRFTKFSVKQACKPKKKVVLLLTSALVVFGPYQGGGNCIVFHLSFLTHTACQYNVT